MVSKDHIDEIIKQTFIRLELAYKNHREGQIDKSINHKKGESRLVFPCYNNKKREIRMSEQELRFIFVETFNEYCDEKELDWYYSVETPTRDKYVGFAEGHPEIAKDHEGRSAEFDLVIFDKNLKRICLIEFKALNADEHDHIKDFVKLDNEEEGKYDDVLRYFIEVLKSYTEGEGNTTIASLKAKNRFNKSSEFCCYALEGKSKRNRANDSMTDEDKNISEKIKK